MYHKRVVHSFLGLEVVGLTGIFGWGGGVVNGHVVSWLKEEVG